MSPSPSADELVRLPAISEAVVGAGAERSPAVVRHALALGVEPPSDAAWASLTVLQRFTLIKLTRDSHDNINFLPAMREFALLSETEGRGPTAD